jgi:hypothetical protein
LPQLLRKRRSKKLEKMMKRRERTKSLPKSVSKQAF